MRTILGTSLALLVLACSPAEEPVAVATGSDEAAGSEASGERAAPEVFAGTAWRAVSEDGARYTTYLDPDGTYRDLRNGDEWQTGTWRYDVEAGALLCFAPEAEDGVESCWKPGKMHGDKLDATDSGGRRIELHKVEYMPSSDEGEASA
ncbi:MAG: hypothetical protein R3E14_05515 [Erythrobacter sp.]